MHPRNLLVVQVWAASTIWFGFSTVHEPYLQHIGGWILDPYLSTGGFYDLPLDLLIPASDSDVWGFLFTVLFRYPTVNRKILTTISHCHYMMHCLPWMYQNKGTCSPPHSGNKSQWRVNAFWSSINGSLSGDWSQTFLNELLVPCRWMWEGDTLPALFRKRAWTECD
jgi:hypothetical protein